MTTINEFMTLDHRACDGLFSNLENKIAEGNLTNIYEKFEEFNLALLKHFDMEEKVIFPEFNQKNIAGCNPTGVMIMEHNQMRALVEQMRSAIRP